MKALTSIGRAAVVKPTAVPETFIPGEKELFSALMPVHIHQVKRKGLKKVGGKTKHSPGGGGL